MLRPHDIAHGASLSPRTLAVRLPATRVPRASRASRTLRASARARFRTPKILKWHGAWCIVSLAPGAMHCLQRRTARPLGAWRARCARCMCHATTAQSVSIQAPNLLRVVRSSAGGDRLRVYPSLAMGEDRSGGAQAPCIFVHAGSSSASERCWLGVGGSFTEASAVTWQKLSPSMQEEIITAYFHPTRGLCYNLGRVPIGSCDFSLYNWSCGEIDEGDWDLKGFSIKRYEEAILPMLRAASKHVKLALMASPWSPPPWMKTVKSFHGEGHLRADCREVWAKHFVRFVEAMKGAGVPIWAVSVQNEPEAAQCWECYSTALSSFLICLIRDSSQMFGISISEKSMCLFVECSWYILVQALDSLAAMAQSLAIHRDTWIRWIWPSPESLLLMAQLRGTWSESEQLALAQDIAEEVRRHGGQLQANHLPSIRPDFRKRLGDEKLLQFISRFPNLLQIQSRHNGHVLSLTDAPLQPSVQHLLGCAPGATCPGRLGERAVHALRQLDRELLKQCARSPQSVDVAYLLHNGKLRRKIGAVVRFLPLTELIMRESEGPEGATEPGKGCPLSAHARTYAGYLLQFLRDRPEKFQLERGGRRDSTSCANGDPMCSCHFQVLVLPRDGVDDDEDDEALMALLLQKIRLVSQSTGSRKVPLVRLGRDAQVKEALCGRSLLHCLERHLDQACRGARIRLETCGALMVSLTDDQEPMEADMPTPVRGRRRDTEKNRRSAGPVNLLGEAPGMAVLLKPPGHTSEEQLEALQAHYDLHNVERRVISVSRLDRDTSGVLVAATCQEGADCLTNQFKEHEVFKRYLALCTGRVEPQEGEISAKLFISGFAEKYRAYVSPKGKPSLTIYQVLGVFRRRCCAQETERLQGTDELMRAIGSYVVKSQRKEPCDEEWYSLLACYPRTGRTHQIRAHLQFRGHPLVSDANYNPRGQARRHFEWCPRLWLHCEEMSLLDVEGRRQHFRAPLPLDLLNVLEKLEAADGTSAVDVVSAGRDAISHTKRFAAAHEQFGLIRNMMAQMPFAKSCIYTAEEEKVFVRDHLGPALRSTYPEVKIMAWDHNRDGMLERASVMYDDPAAAEFVWGVAYHWYGDARFETWPPRTEVVFDDRQEEGEVKELKACSGFENVRRLADLRPDKRILFTEGCQELGGRELSSVLHDWKLGERYSMNMIADMNSGCEGWIDWNLCLDEEGGPNHVGNTCVAPVICNTEKGEVLYQPSFWHLGHFSRYIRPGARRLLCSSTRDALEVTAFLNPDGQVVVVVLNQSEEDIGFWFKAVRHQSSTRAVEMIAPRRSIQTLLVEDGTDESWFSRISRSLPFQLRLWMADVSRRLFSDEAFLKK
eukprot:s159_g24.t2